MLTAGALTLSCLLLLLSLIRGQLLARQLAALKAEAARALDDDGLMAQLETAEAAGSQMAGRLLEAGRTLCLPLPASDKQRHRVFPALDGAALDLFLADHSACQSIKERRDAYRRWHERGYQFPLYLKVRAFERCAAASPATATP